MSTDLADRTLEPQASDEAVRMLLSFERPARRRRLKE
jgi:hypothetical protein